MIFVIFFWRFRHCSNFVSLFLKKYLLNIWMTLTSCYHVILFLDIAIFFLKFYLSTFRRIIFDIIFYFLIFSLFVIVKVDSLRFLNNSCPTVCHCQVLSIATTFRQFFSGDPVPFIMLHST